MVEIELPNSSDTVPDGLKFSPRHFLAAPDEEFRNHMEGDNHQHYIMKVNKVQGHFVSKEFGTFTSVEDEFCFETDLKNESLCFLVVTSDNGEKRPECKHGAQITFGIAQTPDLREVCPSEDETLQLYAICKGQVNDFKEIFQDHIKYLNRKLLTSSVRKVSILFSSVTKSTRSINLDPIQPHSLSLTI